MKKKLVSVLLASALIASALTGCGNGGTTADNGAATTDSGTDAAEDSNDKLVLRSPWTSPQQTTLR